MKQTRKDLIYLTDNNLLDGVAYNEVDDKLVYYTHNPKENVIVLVECPGCGATIKLNKYSKKRCKYCNMIIEYNQKNK